MQKTADIHGRHVKLDLYALSVGFSELTVMLRTVSNDETEESRFRTLVSHL